MYVFDLVKVPNHVGTTTTWEVCSSQIKITCRQTCVFSKRKDTVVDLAGELDFVPGQLEMLTGVFLDPVHSFQRGKGRC